MSKRNQMSQRPPIIRQADRSVWLVWLGMFLLAVAILPFAVRNSEIARQISAMCGFTLS